MSFCRGCIVKSFHCHRRAYENLMNKGASVRNGLPLLPPATHSVSSCCLNTCLLILPFVKKKKKKNPEPSFTSVLIVVIAYKQVTSESKKSSSKERNERKMLQQVKTQKGFFLKSKIQQNKSPCTFTLLFSHFPPMRVDLMFSQSKSKRQRGGWVEVEVVVGGVFMGNVCDQRDSSA